MGLSKPDTRAPSLPADLPASALASHDETDLGRDSIPMDQHDRYLLPRPDEEGATILPWTRSSTLKGRTQTKDQLHKYDVRMIMKGLAISPDLIALTAATPLNERGAHGVLAEIAEQARVRAGGRASANLGSAVHAFTDQLDKGEPLSEVLERVPLALRPDIVAYAKALDAYGLTPVPEYVERVVVNTSLQTGLTWDGQPRARKDSAAGTAARFDRMYLWTDPEDGVQYLVGGDLKTGKNAVEYGAAETACQIAVAVHADAMWNEDTEQYDPMPPRANTAVGVNPDSDGGPYLRTDIGFLIHLPIGSGDASVEVLDLRFGWELAQLGVRMMLADKARNHIHHPLAPAFPQRFVIGSGEPEETVPVPAGVIACGPGGAVTELTPGDAAAVQEFADLLEHSTVPAKAKRTAAEILNDKTEGPKRVEIRGGRKPEDGTAKDGSPLQPLARDVGAARGCSACGRIKHRAGSPKCWGAEDPAAGTKAEPLGPMTGRPSAGGPIGYVPPAEGQEEDDDAPSDGPENGTDAPMAMDVPEAPPCSHSKGYTRVRPPEDAPEGSEDRWVCGACGAESPRAADARRAREAMDSPGPRPAEPEVAVATATGPYGETWTADPEPDGAPEDPAADEAELDALLADPAPESPSDAVHRFIREATDRADLQRIRRGALEAGTWTKEHTAAGLTRLKELTD